jgi:hypothetical protein
MLMPTARPASGGTSLAEKGNTMKLFQVLACGMLAFALGVLPAFAQGPQPPAGAKAPPAASSAAPGPAPSAKGAPSAQPPAATAQPAAGAAAPPTAGASVQPTAGAPPAQDAGQTAPPAQVAAPGQPSQAPTAAQAAPKGPVMDGATYGVRLRDLEQRIDDLKEQIRRSHTRLSLLSDTILSGGGAGSRASIQFKNELSSAFRITRVLIVLDGAVQYNKTDQSGSLSEQAEIPVFTGSIPPGDHTVQVLVNLQGNGYGVFSYLRGYKFEVRSSHSFTAVEGKTVQLQVLAYEKGGVTTPLEERPAVRYVEKVVSGLVDSTTQPAPAAPGQPAAAK